MEALLKTWLVVATSRLLIPSAKHAIAMRAVVQEPSQMNARALALRQPRPCTPLIPVIGTLVEELASGISAPTFAPPPLRPCTALRRVDAAALA